MAYRNKTYICFDGDNDMRWYRLMQAWSANERFEFDFYNAHDLNTARDSSQEESIKRQLRERLANSKLMIVLIGERTRYLTKFVKWEMEVALKADLPIIGVNINGSRQQDDNCPGALMGSLVLYVPFGMKIVEFAMKDWPEQQKTLKAQGTSGARYYLPSVYAGLGL